MPLHAKNPILISNEKGFSLIELLAALVILMVGLLGMLQAINISIQANLQNELRTQGVLVAEEQLSKIKSRPFGNISATGVSTGNAGEKSISVPVVMRSAFINYSVTNKVDNVSSTTKRINVGVRWKHKGNKYEQVVSAVVAESTTR